MNPFRRAAMTIVAISFLVVAACSGAPAAADNPAGAVQAAMNAAQSGGIAAMADYTCAAQKDELANLFGSGGDLGNLAALGVDPNELFDAMKFEFKDVQATEKSTSGDTAVVNLKGTMTIKIDDAKMREVMKQVMEAQGQAVDDATLTLLINTMSSQISQPQPLDQDVTVVKEGGKWLMCS